MPTQRRIVLPDTHVPFQDTRLLDAWLLHAESLKVDAVDLIGDLIDCHSISKFDKNPDRKETLAEDIDATIKVLGDIRLAVGKSVPLHYCEGNHEDRLRRYLWGKAPALAGLRGLSIPELLRLSSEGVTWHPAGSPHTAGDLVYTHGSLIRKHAGASARALSDRSGTSLIMGHSHRMGYIPCTTWAGTRHAYEVGHIADPQQMDYVEGTPQWQQGWAVVTIGKGWHNVEFVRKVPVGARGKWALVFRDKELPR